MCPTNENASTDSRTDPDDTPSPSVTPNTGDAPATTTGEESDAVINSQLTALDYATTKCPQWELAIGRANCGTKSEVAFTARLGRVREKHTIQVTPANLECEDSSWEILHKKERQMVPRHMGEEPDFPRAIKTATEKMVKLTPQE